jgi:hypothetical protein
VKCPDGSDIAKSTQAGAVTGSAIVITGQAFLPPQSGIRRWHNRILRKQKVISWLVHMKKPRFWQSIRWDMVLQGCDSAYSVLINHRGYGSLKSAPSNTPAVEFGDQSRRGSYLNYITRFNTMQHEITRREKNMSREEMIEYITGRLEAADDLKLEQYYWFFQCEEE